LSKRGAAAGSAAPSFERPPPPPLKAALTLGPWCGYDIRERDPGNPLRSSNLVGPELGFEYALSPRWVAIVDGAIYNTLATSASDGWGARGIVGVHRQWNLGAWHPFICPHVAYIAGEGAHDGILVGPEVGVNVDVSRNMFLYARAGYDHDFRYAFNQGIANGGIGAGYRF
jgi:hypothetical protein